MNAANRLLPAQNMSMDVDGFSGVPALTLQAIGSVTVASGALEHAIRLIAVDMYIDPGKSMASNLLDQIRKRARMEQLPGHARTSAASVVDWADRADELLIRRNTTIHSTSVLVLDAGETVPVMVHLRSGKQTRADQAQLSALAARIQRAANDGVYIDHDLRHSPRLGVYLPNAVVDGQWTPMCNTDVGGGDMPRPTESEMDEWWRTLGPFPSFGAAAKPEPTTGPTGELSTKVG